MTSKQTLQNSLKLARALCAPQQSNTSHIQPATAQILPAIEPAVKPHLRDIADVHVPGKYQSWVRPKAPDIRAANKPKPEVKTVKSALRPFRSLDSKPPRVTKLRAGIKSALEEMFKSDLKSKGCEEVIIHSVENSPRGTSIFVIWSIPFHEDKIIKNHRDKEYELKQYFSENSQKIANMVNLRLKRHNRLGLVFRLSSEHCGTIEQIFQALEKEIDNGVEDAVRNEIKNQ
ncbi:hypothetical protein HK096_001345 [Nowakowskiella sp. JEL0078]|nr:hypothetical protein HK096_001345 [Nowakowskiella sp. JEL0078]